MFKGIKAIWFKPKMSEVRWS